MQSFTLSALVLCIEHRSCTTCLRSYKVPSNVMLALDNKGTRTLMTLPANGLEYDLPREIRHVNTTVPACEECFSLQPADPRQMHLFEKTKEKFALLSNEYLIAKRVVKRTEVVRAEKLVPKKPPEPKLEDIF